MDPVVTGGLFTLAGVLIGAASSYAQAHAAERAAAARELRAEEARERVIARDEQVRSATEATLLLRDAIEQADNAMTAYGGQSAPDVTTVDDHRRELRRLLHALWAAEIRVGIAFDQNAGVESEIRKASLALAQADTALGHLQSLKDAAATEHSTEFSREFRDRRRDAFACVDLLPVLVRKATSARRSTP